jgi:hypothetical protein
MRATWNERARRNEFIYLRHFPLKSVVKLCRRDRVHGIALSRMIISLHLQPINLQIPAAAVTPLPCCACVLVIPVETCTRLQTTIARFPPVETRATIKYQCQFQQNKQTQVNDFEGFTMLKLHLSAKYASNIRGFSLAAEILSL